MGVSEENKLECLCAAKFYSQLKFVNCNSLKKLCRKNTPPYFGSGYATKNKSFITLAPRYRRTRCAWEAQGQMSCKMKKRVYEVTSSNPHFIIGKSIVKNLFGTQDLFILNFDVYLQILLSRLTLVVKTRLFLKPLNVDKNRLAAYHMFNTKKTVLTFEKHARVWLTLFHFSAATNWQLLPTACC
jgi:hypothetical protein